MSRPGGRLAGFRDLSIQSSIVIALVVGLTVPLGVATLFDRQVRREALRDALDRDHREIAEAATLVTPHARAHLPTMPGRAQMTQPLVAEPDLYEEDFLAWLEREALLLRSGRVAEADLAHIAQELEDLGGNQRRELWSRLRILLAHLLKCDRQPARRSRSWERTILTQRREIGKLLQTSPSLRPTVAAILAEVYPVAVELAALDTGLTATAFPERLPWDVAQVLGDAPSPARRRRA